MKTELPWKLTVIFSLFLCATLLLTFYLLNDKVTDFVRSIAAVFVAVAISFFILMALISHYVSKPIKRLSALVERMAVGDFSEKMVVSSDDEIGRLAKTLTYLSEELKRRIEMVSMGESRLKSILSCMLEGVLVTDRNGEIILMNPALRKMFMTDLPVEGRKPIEVLRNSVVQELADSIVSKREEFMSREIVILQPEERTIKVNAVPVMVSGERAGALLVFHDISPFKYIEDVRRDFVANVSHELRTPLSSIIGYTETLLNIKTDDTATIRDFLTILHTEGVRLSKLIDDLLDLSKIESGKIKMNFVPADLTGLIRRAVGTMKNISAEKKIELSCELPAGIPPVRCDEMRIVQVLINLLDNAIKFTQPGGCVKMKAVQLGDFVQIDVSDTGQGIPKEELPRIFERFYTGDKSHSTGSGLGLSISKHIIAAHGGEIWAVSVPGAGSTFSFTLPLY